MWILISQVLTIVFLIGIVLLTKRRRDRDQQAMRDEIKSALNKATNQIVEQVSVAKQSQALGLVEVTPDFAMNIDYDAIILNSRRLTVVVNDGRTWASVNKGKLRKRFSNPSKETTFFLIHPDSPMVEVLARKGSVEPSIIRQRIHETISILSEISTQNTQIEILGHYLINCYSVILGDESVVITPYFLARGGRTVPAFRYRNLNSEEGYYQAICEDLEILRMDATSLMPTEKKSRVVELQAGRRQTGLAVLKE